MGDKWPEKWPVWVRTKYVTGGWWTWNLDFLGEIELDTVPARNSLQIVVFNGNGPPPDDWKPEEEKENG
jgi:hypothetical protein